MKWDTWPKKGQQFLNLRNFKLILVFMHILFLLDSIYFIIMPPPSVRLKMANTIEYESPKSLIYYLSKVRVS